MVSSNGVAWNFQNTTNARSLGAVIFAEGRFLGAGDGGRLAESLDGTNWVDRESGLSGELIALAHGPSGYLAGGSLQGSGVIYHSTDGSSWQTVLNLPGRPVRAIASGAGRIAAVASGPLDLGVVAVSTNGLAWEVQETAQRYSNLIFAQGLFVAVGADGAVGTSSDGRAWDVISITTNRLATVAHGAGVFLAAGDSKLGEAWSSPDAIHWVRHLTGQALEFRASAFGRRSFLLAGTAGWVLHSDLVRPELGIRAETGQAVVRFADPVNQPLDIERSSDLLHWERLPAGQSGELREPLAGSAAFYRVRAPAP